MKPFVTLLSLFILTLNFGQFWALFHVKHVVEQAVVGGLKIQLTNRGLKTATKAVEDTSKKVIGLVVIDDYVHPDGDNAIKNKIMNVDAPKIEAKFKEATGIDLNMTIPKLDGLSSFKIGDLPSPVNATSEIKNVISKVMLKVKPGAFKQPTLDVSFCSSNVSSVETSHSDDGIKNKLNGLASKVFKNKLPDSLCKAIKSVASAINSAFLNFGQHGLPQISDLISGGKTKSSEDMVAAGSPQFADISSALQGFPKPNLTLFCGVVSRVHEAHQSGKIMGIKGFVSYLSTQLKNVTNEIPGMKFKTSMQKEAQYSDDDMNIHLEAGFEVDDDEPTVKSFNLPTLKPLALPTLPSINKPTLPHGGGGSPAPTSVTRVPASKANNDLCLSLEDKVVNSFFKLGQQHGFFNTSLNVTQNNIPAPVWNLIKLAFKGEFMMVLDLNTIETPAFHFDEKGGHTTAKFTTDFGIQTGWHHGAERMVEASVDMDVAVLQYIDQHSVKAKLSLGPAPKITLHHIFLTGLLDNVASDLINLLVKNVVWPHVQQKFNQMLGVGIRIPTPCGLSFADPKIVNVPGEMKLCSNLNYDPSGFLARLKQHIEAKDLVKG